MNKNRRQHSKALMAVCQKENVKMDEAYLVVCENRKVVYVLNRGRIHSDKCFFNGIPTPSFRISKEEAAAKSSSSLDAASGGSGTGIGDDKKKSMQESAWTSILIPDGWKVAVVVNEEPWTAEVQYDKFERPEYQFARLNENGERIDESGWMDTPGAAFKSVHKKIHPEVDVGRHNGKLYVGCHYDNPQKVLRQYFAQNALNANVVTQTDAIRMALESWIKGPTGLEIASETRSRGRGRTSDSLRKKSRPADHGGVNTDLLLAVNAVPSYSYLMNFQGNNNFNTNNAFSSSSSSLLYASAQLSHSRPGNTNFDTSSFNPTLVMPILSHSNSMGSSSLSAGEHVPPQALPSPPAQYQNMEFDPFLFSNKISMKVPVEHLGIFVALKQKIPPNNPDQDKVEEYVRVRMLTSPENGWMTIEEIYAGVLGADEETTRKKVMTAPRDLIVFVDRAIPPFTALRRVLDLFCIIQICGSHEKQFQSKIEEFIVALQLIENRAAIMYTDLKNKVTKREIITDFLDRREMEIQQMIKSDDALRNDAIKTLNSSKTADEKAMRFVYERVKEMDLFDLVEKMSCDVFVRMITFLPLSKYLKDYIDQARQRYYHQSAKDQTEKVAANGLLDLKKV